MIVVTGEQLVDPSSKKPKIPNVCKQFGVDYIGPYEMLRQLGAKFDMRPGTIDGHRVGRQGLERLRSHKWIADEQTMTRSTPWRPPSRAPLGG